MAIMISEWASLMKHMGKVLVVDEDVTVLEGEWHGTRTVIVEYESVDAARAWYESPEYAAALPVRQRAASCNVAILSGFEMSGQRNDAESGS